MCWLSRSVVNDMEIGVGSSRQHRHSTVARPDSPCGEHSRKSVAISPFQPTHLLLCFKQMFVQATIRGLRQ